MKIPAPRGFFLLHTWVQATKKTRFQRKRVNIIFTPFKLSL